MASVNIFETLRQRVIKDGTMLPMEKRAMFWFHRYETDLTRWQQKIESKKYGYTDLETANFGKRLVIGRKVQPGFLYFFLYDAKGHNTLPYYDRLPFTLVLSEDDTGFIGLNFHYLDYRLRAQLFDLLYAAFRERGKMTIETHLRATYDMLNALPKYKAFRPCIKRYLFTQIRTPLLQVAPQEWDVALFLPVEQFHGANKTVVWKASRDKISGGNTYF